MRWMRLALVLANIGMLAVNGRMLVNNRMLAGINTEVAAELRKRTVALPSHPCGAVVLPGESCIQTFVIEVPREAVKEPSY